MNVRDSEQIVALMKTCGYEKIDDPQKAELIVINTCSIREKAAQKVFSQLGRFKALKLKNEHLILAIGGCLAQQMGERLFEKFSYLDLIFGTQNIYRLPEFVKRIEETGLRVVETGFYDSVKSIAIVAPPEYGSVCAYVTIMQGCNNFCSFCVVPYLRGREESRAVKDILEEIEFLADCGIKEVTLLGQNVNSYGSGLSNGSNFPSLLYKISKVAGIKRIRFTTSHPKDLSDDLIRCYIEIDQLCEHIHLPVQSGSDVILKKMNRDYTRDDYLDKIEKLRRLCPGISITSDVIVGFPGEIDKDFQETINLMEKVKFDSLFSFKYSEREGTVAVKFDQKVSEDVKDERLHILQSLQNKHTFERNRMIEGRIEEVLVEGASKKSWCDVMGRTRSNKIVNFAGNSDLTGKTVPVLIKQAYLHSLRGELQG
jgi:tRNA-2-methylthio-N6-dimethylallyladenosine synthase